MKRIAGIKFDPRESIAAIINANQELKRVLKNNAT